jgi:hypothetical protein
VIYDLTGSYRVAFGVSIAAIVVAAVTLAAAGRVGPRESLQGGLGRPP